MFSFLCYFHSKKSDFWHFALPLLFWWSGADFFAKVKSLSPKASPVRQGGLETVISMVVKWDYEGAMNILRSQVGKVSYAEDVQCSVD